MTDLAYIEQELTALTNQLKQSFEVLDDLTQVQSQFGDLTQTHQKYKEIIGGHTHTLEAIAQSQKALDQRLHDLASDVEQQKKELQKELQKELRSQLSDIQAEVSTGDRTLKTELLQHLNSWKREIDEQLMDAAQEWERQKNAAKAPLEEFENRLRSEIKAAVNWVNQSGVNAGQVEMLDTQIRANRNTIQTLEKQLRQLRNWLVFSIVLIVILALGLPVTLLVAQSSNNRINTPQPSEPEFQSNPEELTP